MRTVEEIKKELLLREHDVMFYSEVITRNQGKLYQGESDVLELKLELEKAEHLGKESSQ